MPAARNILLLLFGPAIPCWRRTIGRSLHGDRMMPVIISRSSDLALKKGYRLIIVSMVYWPLLEEGLQAHHRVDGILAAVGAFDAICTNAVDINARSPPLFRPQDRSPR